MDTFYEILRINGFKAISNFPGICGVDPLVRVSRRTSAICEIPFTVFVDFYRRTYFQNRFTHADYGRYLEATKAYIKTRFDLGLFSVLMLHVINFYPDPLADFGYPGGNLGGRFLDNVLTWVEERYPGVKFVGMSDLIDLAQD
jgi:hypothetical protein